MPITGDPDQTYGEVAVADVVRAIRDLKPGFHTVEEVHRRYLEVSGTLISPRIYHVTRLVSWFCPERYAEGGEDGWWIYPASIAARYPRLPWDGLTVECQRDDWAEMPPVTVGWHP
jgi:hypothetical protein